MPTLYLVGTPIGNLEDITLRAVRVLKEVALVAAEDTRRAKVLFARYGIATPLTSYHEQGAKTRLPVIMRRLAERDVALVTEAGMPALSDPGFSLVQAALAQGTRVEVVPGPSAVTAALALSGLPMDQFVFLGFLPRQARERRRLLESVVDERRTLVAFEAPHRLRATLEGIAEVMGERPLAVCRELTKLHQEVFRGTATAALARFAQPRGEITLVIGGRRDGPQAAPAAESVRARLRELRGMGLGARDAVRRVVGETGLPRREVYRMWVEAGRDVAVRSS